MKKKILIFVVVAMMWNVCGCEMNHGTADSRVDISTSTDDVEQMREAQEEKLDETGESVKQLTRPFITRNCLYRLDNMEGNLIQSDLHGKRINKFKIEAWDENLRISDFHICYMEGETLYVSPIRQKENGEEIIWEEKEKIVKEPEETALIEPYLIYVTDTVYRYNLNTGETLPLGTTEEFGNVFFHDNWWLLPDVYDGKMYLDSFSEKDSLYQIDIEEWKARKLFTYTEDEDDLMSDVIGARGELVCVDINTEAHYNELKIACFNMGDNTKTILTGEEITAMLEKEGLWEEGCKEKDWTMDSSFSYGDKIYMVVHMSWVRKGIMKRWGEKGKTAVERTLLLSCPWNDIKNITYEKEISEWWYNRAERYTLWGEYDCFEEYSIGDILTLYNGELYMNYSDEKGYHIVAYNMENKTYRELDKKETEYRLMDWSWDG